MSTLQADEWERWRDQLTPTTKERFDLLRVLMESGRTITVGQVADELFPDSRSVTARQRNLHRFVDEVNRATTDSGVEAYIRLDAAKSLGDDRAVALMRGLAHEPAVHSGLAESSDRLLDAIEDLGDDPRPHGAKKLVGEKTAWRIRVGDYRVIYDVFDDVLTVTIVRAAHRHEAYSR